MKQHVEKSLDAAIVEQWYRTIPGHTYESLKRYVIDGIEPGGFLTAVLSNDLIGAVANADDQNEKQITTIAKFVYNRCPIGCSGSKEKVNKWIEDGGLT
jgi:hypothetical protein